MLVLKCLCLFACCPCHQGFADAWILLCTLLLPSRLCRCLWWHIYVYLHAALAIRALQMLEFAVHATLAIADLQVLVVTSLCLFACRSCHQGFADSWINYFVLHAALAIGALQVLVVTRLCLFACCSCHRGFADTWICCARCSCHWGFAGACGDKFVFICVLLLPSELCKCL